LLFAVGNQRTFGKISKSGQSVLTWNASIPEYAAAPFLLSGKLVKSKEARRWGGNWGKTYLLSYVGEYDCFWSWKG